MLRPRSYLRRSMRPVCRSRSAACARRSKTMRCCAASISMLRPVSLFVVGRSGCGKSTLLRLLAGLDRPTSGTIRFGDEGAEFPERTVTRVMFQEPRLLPWARVLANVEVGLGETGNAPGARDQARAALREVGLEARGADWPSVLSGGQEQWVPLARALVSRPEILAFDEPLGALDALTRISMQQLLERVWGEQGFTAILVTHDVAEAVTLADRVPIIEILARSRSICGLISRVRASAVLARSQDLRAGSCASFCATPARERMRRLPIAGDEEAYSCRRPI